MHGWQYSAEGLGALTGLSRLTRLSLLAADGSLEWFQGLCLLTGLVQLELLGPPGRAEGPALQLTQLQQLTQLSIRGQEEGRVVFMTFRGKVCSCVIATLSQLPIPGLTECCNQHGSYLLCVYWESARMLAS